MAESNDWGREAENIAVDYLVGKGYPIRERNWSPRGGHVETDIITQEGNMIVFVEVKAKRDKDYDPADAVDDKKIHRLVRCAAAYMAQQPDGLEYRFDIITVSGSADDYEIDHIPDAFLPPLTQ